MAGKSGNSVQLGWREDHSSIILGSDDLVIWGGYQDGLPRDVHDSEKKRSFTTKLDVLNLPSMEWNSVSTSGTPPAGAINYRADTIGGDIYLFDGGRCCGGECVHNDLYKLNINDKVWRCMPCINKPMKKHSCGFISYSYQGSDYLLALGGKGGKHPPTESQLHSLYTPDISGYYYTNEVHIMNVTTSPGQWISPTVTGDRPLALSDFSLHLLPHSGNQAISFGGFTVPEEGEETPLNNDTYKLSMTNDTVHFTKLSGTPPCLVPRYWHASTIISTSTQDYLLVIGGYNDDGFTLGVTVGILSDCWILDPASRKWSMINLPDSVCQRYGHSVCSVTVNANTVWIIMTGGSSKLSLRKDPEVSTVVELECNDSISAWKVIGVWNTAQSVELTERIKRLRPTNTQPDNSTLRRMDGQEMTHLSQQLRETTAHQLQKKEQELEKKWQNHPTESSKQ